MDQQFKRKLGAYRLFFRTFLFILVTLSLVAALLMLARIIGPLSLQGVSVILLMLVAVTCWNLYEDLGQEEDEFLVAK